jgi:hypothetical protein
MDLIDNNPADGGITNLPGSSRVWVYQSNRKFTVEETEAVQSAISDFTRQWVSHNQALRAQGAVYHHQFLVLMVDESQAGASGCSIDSSVQFVRQLQQELGVDFFDRMLFAWQDGDEVHMAHRMEFAELYKNGVLTEETLVFDNLVKTKGDFETAWVKRLGDSWHKRMV